MDFLTSNSALLLEKSMGYLWTKQTAILNNITNADTPDYKASYVTFEDALKEKLEKVMTGSGTSAQIRSVLESAEPEVRVASDESVRMDGNGVDVTEQSAELVKNAYQLQYVMKAMNSDITMLQTAIKG